MPVRTRRARQDASDVETDTDAENEANKNAGWIGARGSGVFYVLLLAIVWGLAYILLEDLVKVATLVNVSHAVVTFFSFHYTKGSQVWTDSGEFDDMTFWQQLDGGYSWTASKKLLMGVPVIL